MSRPRSSSSCTPRSKRACTWLATCKICHTSRWCVLSALVMRKASAIARPPSLTVPVQAIPCSCRYHKASVQLSPSTATAGSVAHTCELWTSTSTLIGFPSLAAVLFIQGQHPPLLRHLLLQPLLRTLSGLLHDGRDGSQAHLLTQQHRQAYL